MTGRTWGRGQERVCFKDLVLKVPEGDVRLFQQHE